MEKPIMIEEEWMGVGTGVRGKNQEVIPMNEDNSASRNLQQTPRSFAGI